MRPVDGLLYGAVLSRWPEQSLVKSRFIKSEKTDMQTTNVKRWHEFVLRQDPAMLDDLLHDEVVFTSPVVHTPQRGKALTATYLNAAARVLGGKAFEYVREFDCGSRAVLEFVSEIDGIQINGVDMIEWDEEGKITDFKVMVRPLKAIQAVHGRMAEMLQQMARAEQN